jgi:Endonuclease-reverse transcriptase
MQYRSAQELVGQLTSYCLLSILLLLCGDTEQNPVPGHPNSSTFTLVVLTSVLPLTKRVASMTLYLIVNLTFWRCVKLALNLTIPPAVKDSIVPDDYSDLHAHRNPSRAHPSGGGLALIHRNSVVIRPHQLASALSPHPSFELQLMKMSSTTPSLTVATVYRPPQTSLVNFYVELADLLTIIASQTDRLLVIGDFNCPGDGPTTIATELSETFESLGLRQHVRQPTSHENLLDLVVIDKSLTVRGLCVDDAGQVSNHQLVIAAVSVCPGFCQPVQVKSRRIRSIDTNKFKADLRRSVLFSQPSTTADDFAAQLQDTVVAALDRVVPFRTRKRRPPKPITRWLSDDAVDAKRLRRRLNRRWKFDLRESDRVAYRLACHRANKLINSSRQDYFRCQFANAANCKDRWRAVKHLLHSSKSTSSELMLRTLSYVLNFVTIC